jgi:hypothetical protein
VHVKNPDVIIETTHPGLVTGSPLKTSGRGFVAGSGSVSATAGGTSAA